MKIVCNIPDGAYEELCNGQFPVQDAYRIVAWVKDGKPYEECKNGRWNDDCTCSVCGTYSSLNLSKVKYCPECGAKMEGAEE